MDTAALLSAMPPYTHGIYLNNAGASLMSNATVAAVAGHLALESAMGGYGAVAAAAPALEAVYADAARLLGCAPDEIALSGSNSGSWQTAIAAMRFGPGDRILVGRSEWGGNYGALLRIARLAGATVEEIPVDEYGETCTERLRAMLDERVRLISLTWLPCNGGLINPAAQVGRIARAAGIPYILDAAQAVGQLPVDVEELHCDVLTAPGRKWLRGPRGTGLLYVRRAFLSRLEPVAPDHYAAAWNGSEYVLRDDARRFETGEASYALRLGLGAAIREALELGVGHIRADLSAKAERLRQDLSAIDGVRVLDLGRERSALVSFALDALPAQDVRSRLSARGIEVAVNGMAFTPLDAKARGLGDIVRASPHVYTTHDELDHFVKAVREIAGAA